MNPGDEDGALILVKLVPIVTNDLLAQCCLPAKVLNSRSNCVPLLVPYCLARLS